MKVLSVNKYYQLTGGGDRFFFDTNDILVQNGHEVIPYCLAYPNNWHSPYERYFPVGIPGTAADQVGILGKVTLFVNGIYSIEAKRCLRQLLHDVTPDVAHLHVLHYTMSPSVIDALHDAGLPVVFSLHDYRIVCVGGYLYANDRECHECKGGRHYSALKHRCYRNSRSQSLMGVIGNYLYAATDLYSKVDLFTVPHESMRNLLHEFGVDRERVRILKNPLLIKEQLPPATIGDYVLFFGHLSRAKGVYTLLDAISRLPDIRFILCGTGPESANLAELIHSRSLTNVQIDEKTRWNFGLQELIAGSRFVVSPSEWPTPLEYSTLETMALGKAIVASRIGGNREIIEDGELGITFTPGDGAHLAQAIEALYSDEVRIEQMGRNARDFIARKFTPEIYYNDVNNIYQEAIERRKARHTRTSA